jgi:AhpD family alkylhydroperoxidase
MVGAVMVAIAAGCGFCLAVFLMLLPLRGGRRVRRVRVEVLPPVTAEVVTRPQRAIGGKL